MASTREIKKRIKAAGNIGKITKAMEMVSAAKMRKAQEKALRSRNYAKALSIILSQISTAVNIDDVALPILRQQKKIGKDLVIVVSTNRGLCGALNSNLFRYLESFLDERGLKKEQLEFIGIGKLAGHYLVNRGYKLVASFTDFHDIPLADEALAVSRLMIDGFTKGEYDTVSLVYSQFINTLTQKPIGVDFLPLSTKELESWGKEIIATEDLESFLKGFILFEPDPTTILEEIIPYALEVKLYQNLLEAAASEHSARMVAMRNAYDNSKEVRHELKLEYNKVRQAKVTNEIADIVTATLSVTQS